MFELNRPIGEEVRRWALSGPLAQIKLAGLKPGTLAHSRVSAVLHEWVPHV